MLAILLIAYFVVAPMGVPGVGRHRRRARSSCWRWPAAGTGAASGAVVPVGKVLRGAPWQIVIFSLGMYLVVYGLGPRRADRPPGRRTCLACRHTGSGPPRLGTGFGAAALSSVMNNMPATLVGALSIQQAHTIPAATRELMVYANVIGCDLGPKFTPIGSLATLLWLHVLGNKGVRIGWGQYMRVCLVITPPVLLATLGALILWLPAVRSPWLVVLAPPTPRPRNS